MRDQYLELASELKKLREIKVTVIAIETGVLGTVAKGLNNGSEVLEIRGRVENIQSTALLRSARILSPGNLKRLAVTQTLALAGMKNS